MGWNARKEIWESVDMAEVEGWIEDVRKTQEAITGTRVEVDKVEPTKGNGTGVLVIERGSIGSRTSDRIQLCQDTLGALGREEQAQVGKGAEDGQEAGVWEDNKGEEFWREKLGTSKRRWMGSRP